MATTTFYTLSLHDALPICCSSFARSLFAEARPSASIRNSKSEYLRRNNSDLELRMEADRKSTRLNSSHVAISYAVFCLKKKKKKHISIYIDYIVTSYYSTF